MADALCCSMYWLGVHNKTVISCRNWNKLEGLESTGSQALAPLHFTISWYIMLWEDGGHVLIFFFEIPAGWCPLTLSFPYLLLRHKIGLDFISGKGVNFLKASSPHIFSRMSHICCLFTDTVPRRNFYLTKVVNFSIPSMQIWLKKSISTAWLRQRTIPKQMDLMRGSSY